MTKRIVLKHVVGPFSGLHRIMGTTDQLLAGLQVEQLPPYIEPVDFVDHKGAARLVKVKPRYVLFHECPPNHENAFHPEQR